MVQKCVIYGCSNTKDEKRGISIHQVPFFGDQRPEAKKDGESGCLRKSQAEELDSIQTFGNLFCSFHASRIQPFDL